MSHLITTQLEQDFRDLAAYNQTKDEEHLDWVKIQSGWGDKQINDTMESAVKHPPAQQGAAKAAGEIIDFLTGKDTSFLSSKAQAILATLEGYKSTEAAQAFVERLRNGQYPSRAGLALYS